MRPSCGSSPATRSRCRATASRRRSPACPPTTASGWAAFRAEYDRTHRDVWAAFNAWVRRAGRTAAARPASSCHESEYANLYVFPEEADYTGRRPLDATWHRMDSSVRETDERLSSCPTALRDRPAGSALVYLSLGSLGSADVDLMRRLVDVLGRTPHRYIVSKGPQHARATTCADNMVGRGVPAADHDHAAGRPGHHPRRQQHDHRGAALRQADGAAAAVLGPVRQRPADGRARASASGCATYEFTEEQLHGAVDRLLDDDELRARLARSASGVRARDGLRRGADVIEPVARSYADGVASEGSTSA